MTICQHFAMTAATSAAAAATTASGKWMDWEMWVGDCACGCKVGLKWADGRTGGNRLTDAVVFRNICLCNEHVIISNGTSSNAGSASLGKTTSLCAP